MKNKKKNNKIFYVLIVAGLLFFLWNIKKGNNKQAGGVGNSVNNGNSSGSGSESLELEQNLTSIGKVEIDFYSHGSSFVENKHHKYLGVKHSNLSDYKLKRTLDEYNRILRDEFYFDKCIIKEFGRRIHEDYQIFPKYEEGSEIIFSGFEYRRYGFGLFRIEFDDKKGLVFNVVKEIGEGGQDYYSDGIEIPFSNIGISFWDEESVGFTLFFDEGKDYSSKDIHLTFESSETAKKLRFLLLEIYDSLR